MKRLTWISENGKYKVLVRHFDGDPSPLIGYWKIQANGKFGPAKFNTLPVYVLDQIEVLKSQVMFKA